MPLPLLQAAKWPPDDADLPDVPGSPYGGAGGGDEGDFKKGRFNPVLMVLAMLVVIGGGAAIIFGIHRDVEKMDPKEVKAEQNRIMLLPQAEQIAKWREWANRTDVPKLQEEAFAALAFVKDPQGLAAIIHGIEVGDHKIRGTGAQALFEYGSPLADSAKPALMKALAEADTSDKPQIAWALALLKEQAAFDAVMAEYRAGHLATVQRADGRPAFDPELLSQMVPIDRFAALSKDPSESVRQLVALILSRAADAKWLPQLKELVVDKSVEVGREAAVGLGRIANEEAMKPLLDALAKADKDSRQKFLEALRDGVGANGLVLALRSVSTASPTTEKFQTKQIFDMLTSIEDPRGADLLVKYIESNPKPHWKTEAAIRLAAAGDLRAVPTLAWRMGQDPLKLYTDADDPELRRDDNERVVSARMLSDLAVLYPDKRGEMRAHAYEPVLHWVTDKPQPHANGLRFLAASESTEALPKMRKWASPADKFPQPGQQEFPQTWATAQSALRYLGWMKDQPSWGLLEGQLTRRPKEIDATMESLLQGGLGVLGMTLRAIGVGASQGFAQWGDPKAFPALVKYIEDRQNNEQSRIEACASLSWVATDDQMNEVVKKVREMNKPDPKEAFIRGCYLETLVHRPVPDATAGLVDLLKGDLDLEVRHQAARAIAFGGMTPPIVAKVFEKMKDVSVRSDAMLALLIGGDSDTARRALAMYNDADPAAMEEVKVIYNQTFGYWSDRNYETGDVARWIENAEACAHVKVRDAYQDWPRLILSRAVQGIEFDNGPHSLTRVQLRVRLLRDARGADEKKRKGAILILKFLKEKGALMALKSESGPHAALARDAFFDVMNPKAVADSLPEAKTDKK